MLAIFGYCFFQPNTLAKLVRELMYILLKTGTESFRTGNKSLKSYYKQ